MTGALAKRNGNRSLSRISIAAAVVAEAIVDSNTSGLGKLLPSSLNVVSVRTLT